MSCPVLSDWLSDFDIETNRSLCGVSRGITGITYGVCLLIRIWILPTGSRLNVHFKKTVGKTRFLSYYNFNCTKLSELKPSQIFMRARFAAMSIVISKSLFINNYWHNADPNKMLLKKTNYNDAWDPTYTKVTNSSMEIPNIAFKIDTFLVNYS